MTGKVIEFKKRYLEITNRYELLKLEEEIKEFSIYNYIPSGVQNEYATALMEEYKKYCKEKVK